MMAENTARNLNPSRTTTQYIAALAGEILFLNVFIDLNI